MNAEKKKKASAEGKAQGVVVREKGTLTRRGKTSLPFETGNRRNSDAWKRCVGGDRTETSERKWGFIRGKRKTPKEKSSARRKGGRKKVGGWNREGGGFYRGKKKIVLGKKEKI